MQQGIPPQGHQNPNEQQQQQQFVGQPPMGGMGGPMRMQMPQQQIRQMPYPSPQMRAGPPPPQQQQQQHFQQMGIPQQQQPQQFTPNGQSMQMQQRPMQMGMAQGPGPSGHLMGMVGGPPPQHMMQQQGGGGPPQFVPNSSPMPLPPQQIMQVQHQQQHQQPPPSQQIQQPPIPQPQQQQAPPPQMIPAAVPYGSIMEKSKLDDLMQQISSTTVLEENVKDVLVEYADDFVSSLIDKACKMIKNREVKKIESRDIEFILKNVYNMPVVPRAASHNFGSQTEVIDLSKEKFVPTEAHKQRVALLKKQIKKL
ncbi:Transcription initiation factor TFIID subunit 12 [Caenorhabditis elegans]|nr:Transcription initiation factor TFIID subunit 12 [Caenorhabditis elegans]CAX65090.1 Transcription initiation factor TFIID subunit 12 [Caenorhabditis elegans]|eukprot:NP_001255145.1 TAF (TBP-associated transcription factor) family [Caenorhabditis elegans]